MFGEMPAHGFYIRHARNVSLSNVEVASLKPDARPPLFWRMSAAPISSACGQLPIPAGRLSLSPMSKTSVLTVQECARHATRTRGSKGPLMEFQ